MIGNLPYNTSGPGSLAPPEAIKCHRITALTSPAVNTWTDFPGLIKVDSESNGDYISLNADGKTLDITKKGLYHFGGCVHYQNNSAGIFSDLKILTRIFKNSTTEARCSQRGKTINFAAGGEDILSYNGTDFLDSGDSLTLQYNTNEPQLVFDSNSNFQSQVAYTIWLIYLGSY